MSLLNKYTRKKIKEHSLSEYPNECCGFLIEKDNDVDVIECENIAFDKKKLFEISAEDYLRSSKKGKIKAYYHSHTEDNFELSGADKAISISHKMPLIMYSIKKNNFTEYIA